MPQPRLSLIIKYLKNNRLKEYQAILESALQASYHIISLRDSVMSPVEPAKKYLILRHDVDHISPATRRMHLIEQSMGARASYYFRNQTAEKELMQEIEETGSEASLHFETLADFMKDRGITDRDTLLSVDFKSPCLERLQENIWRFRGEFGIPCLTIASHGEAINLKVGVPNNALTEDISVYDNLGIRLEAYNKDFLSRVSCYISDTVMEENDGYRYGKHPFQAIREAQPLILFLTHPNHWYYSLYQRFRKIVKVMIRKPVDQPEQFKRL